MYYEISTIVRFNCRLTVSGKGPPPRLGTSVSCRDNNLIHYLTMQMFSTLGCSLQLQKCAAVPSLHSFLVLSDILRCHQD